MVCFFGLILVIQKLSLYCITLKPWTSSDSSQQAPCRPLLVPCLCDLFVFCRLYLTLRLNYHNLYAMSDVHIHNNRENANLQLKRCICSTSQKICCYLGGKKFNVLLTKYVNNLLYKQSENKVKRHSWPCSIQAHTELRSILVGSTLSYK